MNMNDLKSGEPFFDDWYIDSYIDKTQSGAALKIYREQDGLREFSIMKAIEIPRDKQEQCAQSEQMEDHAAAQYYKELVTDIYRKVRLLESLPDRQHIVSYEDHLIYELEDPPCYEIYIRMEYLDRFRESIHAAYMTYQDVVLLGKNICEALDLCERYHIIHGDICPDSIYLSEHGQYKLGDFPFYQADAYQEMGTSVTSLSLHDYSDYAAPEIIAREHYDKRADIYSLGLVMYTCLNNEELPMEERNKPLPANGFKELGQVILKACEFLPEDRYQSAKEFQEALIAISVFLGDSLTEQINSNEMEEPEIYVAATQEDKSECDEVLKQEQAHKELQEELQQQLKSEVSKDTMKEEPKNQNQELGQESSPLKKQKVKGKKAVEKKDNLKDKDEPRVSLAALKKTKNMGPWILAIWTAVLTIAVLVLLIKGDFIIDGGGNRVEAVLPTSVIPSTSELSQDDKDKDTSSVTVSSEEPLPTDEVTPDDLEPESITLLHSKEGLDTLEQMDLLDEATIMDFSDNSITDLSALSTSSKVETLKLNDNAIKDVRPLKKLMALKELDLSDNQIVTVVSLKGLTNLEVLSLSNNLLPNALGIEKLTKLKMLYLDNNDIKDVSKLAALKNLVFLDLSNNRVSKKQILKLQNALPDCIISY